MQQLEEQLIQLEANSPLLGKKCAICSSEFHEGETVVECPRCHHLHHPECWKEQGGCGRRGCPQIAVKVIAEKTAGDPPPKISARSIAAAGAALLALVLFIVFWPSAEDPAMGRTTVHLMGDPLGLHMAEPHIETLNDEHNAIYVEAERPPTGRLEQHFFMLATAGEAPDILILTREQYAEFLERDFLANLATEEAPLYALELPRDRFMSLFFGTDLVEEALEVMQYLQDALAAGPFTETEADSR